MKIIAANWKMNGSFDDSDLWLESFKKKFYLELQSFKNIEAVLCPPSILIDYIDSEIMQDGLDHLELVAQKQSRSFDDFSEDEVKKILIDERPIKLGGQDCSAEEKGAFTGDISANMLKEIGCEYVILGHSERRKNHFESDEIVAKKIKVALANNLTPIICVGENKEIRRDKKHVEFVLNQILKSIPKDDVKFGKLVVAYEPIWSIGTGVVPSLEQIEEMAKEISKALEENFSGVCDEIFLLYGGSVNSKNSKEILSVSKVGGLLVGGASLDAEEFLKICLS